jgi:hypothetical protein
LAKQPGEDFAAVHAGFSRGVAAVAEAATHIATNFSQDIKGVHVGAVPFLRLMGIVSGGWQMARAALVAQSKIATGDNDPYYPTKIATARFYADHILSQAPGLAQTVIRGGAGALAVPEEHL